MATNGRAWGPLTYSYAVDRRFSPVFDTMAGNDRYQPILTALSIAGASVALLNLPFPLAQDFRDAPVQRHAPARAKRSDHFATATATATAPSPATRVARPTPLVEPRAVEATAAPMAPALSTPAKTVIVPLDPPPPAASIAAPPAVVDRTPAQYEAIPAPMFRDDIVDAAPEAPTREDTDADTATDDEAQVADAPYAQTAAGITFVVQAKVNGRALGSLKLLIPGSSIDHPEIASSEIAVQLGAIVDLLGTRLGADMQGLALSDDQRAQYVTLNELRAHGIEASFDHHDRLSLRTS